MTYLRVGSFGGLGVAGGGGATFPHCLNARNVVRTGAERGRRRRRLSLCEDGAWKGM